jgi:predicted nucleic acid-binding protein
VKAGFLLDTSVISALAPGRETHLNTGFAQWLQAHDAQMCLPCVAVAELAQGTGKLRHAGSTERTDRLDVWLDRLIA